VKGQIGEVIASTESNRFLLEIGVSLPPGLIKESIQIQVKAFNGF
jgi:hypothetical protein